MRVSVVQGRLGFRNFLKVRALGFQGSTWLGFGVNGLRVLLGWQKWPLRFGLGGISGLRYWTSLFKGFGLRV